MLMSMDSDGSDGSGNPLVKPTQVINTDDNTMPNIQEFFMSSTRKIAWEKWEDEAEQNPSANLFSQLQNNSQEEDELSLIHI